MVADPRFQRRVEPARCVGCRGTSHIAVARDVVAAENRHRGQALEPSPGERLGNEIERRSVRGRDGVARFGDRQGDDRRVGTGEPIDDDVGFPGRVLRLNEGADDRRGRLTRTPFDRGVQAILRAEGRGHGGIAWQEAQPGDAPVAPGGRQFVGVHGEVSAVEPADSDVDDPALQGKALVTRHRDSPGGDGVQRGRGDLERIATEGRLGGAHRALTAAATL